MPTSFLSADAGFPRLTNDIPMEERMNRVQQYLFMLLEQLRYTLSNLGEENFNETSLKKIENRFSEPIYRQLTDLEGNVTTLEATAAGLYADMYGADGKVTTLEATAEGLRADMYDSGGKVTTLEATAAGLYADMYDAGGKVTTLEATADGLYADMYNANGRVSSIGATADKIGFIVKNYETAEASSFELTSHMASLVANEISISGAVTLSQLENPATQAFINGNNVLLKTDGTGVSDSFLGLVNANGNAYGSFRTQDTSYSTNPYDDNRMVVLDAFGLADNEYVGLRLSSGRSMILEAANTINLLGTQIVMNTSGGHPVIIQADNAPYSQAWCPYGCYCFCDDGIYYNGNRILST